MATLPVDPPNSPCMRRKVWVSNARSTVECRRARTASQGGALAGGEAVKGDGEVVHAAL